MTDEGDVSQASEPQPLDDDALEFVTGGVKLCSSPTTCSTGSGGTTGTGTINQTIYYTSRGTD